jgi:hypothetical protein
MAIAKVVTSHCKIESKAIEIECYDKYSVNYKCRMGPELPNRRNGPMKNGRQFGKTDPLSDHIEVQKA